MRPSLTEIIENADALYAKRSKIENVRQSVELLRESAEKSYEAAWRLGRSFFFLGQEATNQEDARSHHKQGIRAGARAVKLRPERVEGHFWLGVNLALMARLENKIFALFLVWLAKRSLRRAARIDPSYHAAGPLRVLARVQHKLPRVLGGGHMRARESFEKALQLAPENTVTRIYFAELLLDVGETDAAREQLKTIIHTKPDPAWAFEISRDQELAHKLLQP